MKRTLMIIATAGALVALPATVLAADASSSGQQAEPRTAGQTLDDANITAAVKAKLLADKLTQGLRINVTTKNGVVSLSGEVKSAGEKNLAENMALNTTGVKSVQNQLTVKTSG